MTEIKQPKSSGQIDSWPDDNFKDTRRSNSSSTAKSRRLVIAAVIVAVIALTSALTVYLFNDFFTEREQPEQIIAEADVLNNESRILADYGTVVMQGKIGAVPFEMTIDFEQGTGFRSYPSNPGIVHSLSVDSVEELAGGDYRLILSDIIEDRVKVGEFIGVFDGHNYQGVHRSNDGSTRSFAITD